MDWRGGKACLGVCHELAGLRLTSSHPLLPLNSTDYGVDASKNTVITPSPLSVAATHHPAHLKRLRRSVLQPKESGGAGSVTAPPSLSHARIIIADRLEVEKRMHQTLVNAITKLQHSVHETTMAIKALVDVKVGPTPTASSFWTLNFKPQVGREFMTSMEFDAKFSVLGEDSVGVSWVSLGLSRRIRKMSGTRERRPGQCGTGMRRHARRGSAE